MADPELVRFPPIGAGIPQDPEMPSMGPDQDHVSLIEALRHTARVLSNFAARHPESWIMHPAANIMAARQRNIAEGYASPFGPFTIPSAKALGEGLSMYGPRIMMGVDAPEASLEGALESGLISDILSVPRAGALAKAEPGIGQQLGRIAARVPAKVAIAHDLGIPTSEFAIVHGTMHKIAEPMNEPEERARMHQQLVDLRLQSLERARRRQLLARILSNPVGAETMYPPGLGGTGTTMAMGGL